jgi:hypothetical protein
LRFFEVFLPEEPVEKITAERLLEWKVSLQDEYAEASIAGYIKKVKAVLNWAVEQNWLLKSPARKIPTGSLPSQRTSEQSNVLFGTCVGVGATR